MESKRILLSFLTMVEERRKSRSGRTGFKMDGLTVESQLPSHSLSDLGEIIGFLSLSVLFCKTGMLTPVVLDLGPL